MIYHSEKAILYGKILRRLRLEAGLTQAQLSFELGIAAQYISKFETGARYPWRMARLKINEYFEESLDEPVPKYTNREVTEIKR